MRLSTVLSRPPSNDFVQVDGFLVNKQGNIGQQVELSVGNVMLNYYCAICEDMRTFTSNGKLCCIFSSKHIISIDSVLSCGCGTKIQVWFLVESEDDIRGQAPYVRIIKRGEKLSNMVRIDKERYGTLSELIEKANCAHREGLGAGSIVYLRKTFEKITIDMAKTQNIEYAQHEGGNPKNFFSLLEKVDKECSIIPNEFAKDGYKLFRELSSVVHGEYDERLGLMKFEPLHRLVIGILENIRKRTELEAATRALGWDIDGGNT